MLKFLKKRKPTDELKELLGDYELPHFPTVVTNLLSLLRDPSSPVARIAAQIETKPGMSVRVLRMVNSAAFGLRNELSNVQHAVTLLGRSRLEALAVSVAVRDTLPPTDGLEFLRHFWLTAARRASLARALSQHVHPPTQSEAFTAGLLQNIAVPILAAKHGDKYGDKYGEVYRAWQDYEANETRLEELEKEAFGYDHQTIGALVAETWSLPEFLTHAISQHHADINDSLPEVAFKLVSHIRDRAVDPTVDSLVDVCQKWVNLDRDVLHDLVTKSYEDAEEFCRATQG